jgi:hypothetical protein
MTHQTPAPTAAEVERLAREMCRMQGDDPNQVSYVTLDPAWLIYASSARIYLLALAAHRALMEEGGA